MTKVVVPDRVGEPLRAYRMWVLDASRQEYRRWRPSVPNPYFGTLKPFNDIDVRWPGAAKLVAQCQAWDPDTQTRFTHPAPSPKCRCGIYGVKQLKRVEEPLLHLLANRLRHFAEQPGSLSASREQLTWVVVGSVHLWGKVIEGTHGYRAQYAYPERLWLLPPARIGGSDKATVQPWLLEQARDLLIVLRHRYRCPVGYAEHDLEITRLLQLDELGWFFSWRLSHSGADRLGRALGQAAEPTTKLPTISDALKLWLESRPSSHDDKQIVRHLTPAFGPLPVDHTADLGQIHYRPVSHCTGKQFVPRTVARHRRILPDAIDFAHQQWLLEHH